VSGPDLVKCESSDRIVCLTWAPDSRQRHKGEEREGTSEELASWGDQVGYHVGIMSIM